jgi:predicted Fe-Mo cluster-binding NifX family protein
MKAAFSIWDNRIAPVFDVARHICLVQAAPGGVIQKSQEELMGDAPVQKVLRLMELGADTLVCGAISRPVLEMFSGYGIRVFPFVAGELQRVIDAWLRGALDGDRLAMPGCRGRARGRMHAGRGPYQVTRPASSSRSMPAVGPGNPHGRGGGARRRARGAAGAGTIANDYCVCPQCGQHQPHQRGVPCFDQRCPTCNVAMIRV